MDSANETLKDITKDLERLAGYNIFYKKTLGTQQVVASLATSNDVISIMNRYINLPTKAKNRINIKSLHLQSPVSGTIYNWGDIQKFIEDYVLATQLIILKSDQKKDEKLDRLVMQANEEIMITRETLDAL